MCTPESLPRRIRSKFRVDASGCWVWTEYLNRDGYGKVKFGYRQRYAHRLIYELLVRPLSRPEICDHLCRNRACVNPAHIEIVTDRENILRGVGLSATNAKKTHCKRGHDLSGPDVRCYVSPNGQQYRSCRICHRLCEKIRLSNRSALPPEPERANGTPDFSGVT